MLTPKLAWQPVLECSHGLLRGSWEPPDNWLRVNIGLPGQRLNLGRSGRSAGMSQFVEALFQFLKTVPLKCSQKESERRVMFPLL